MHQIDHSFLPDEPESWFRLMFKHEQLEVHYVDTQRRDYRDDDVYIEQMLFQYPDPWTLQIRWTANCAHILSGVTTTASQEPILLEWTNLLANHWACHWLRKNMSPIAAGGLPVRVQAPTKNKSYASWSTTIELIHAANGMHGYLELDWFMPELKDYTPATTKQTWSVDTLAFMDMIPIGTALLNEHGEVTHFNKWLKNKESKLKQKNLPLPWELVFQEGLLHDIWSIYHIYKRASYCTPWLHHIETQTGFQHGPYIVSLSPGPVGATLQLTPITNDQMEELSHSRHDVTTSLLTREAWMDRLSHLPDQDGWLALLGLDGFKQINDTLGHQIGDLYLKEVALRLKNAYPSAVLGRWSGDEFIAWFSESVQPDVRAIFHTPFDLEFETFYGSACVGLNRVIPPLFAQEQIQALEWALRDAKALGKGKAHIVLSENAPVKDVRRQLFYIESRLRQAVALKQFFLLYQPLVRLTDNKIIGAEALIRWRHPELGVVTPQHFIPAAEQNGTIIPMTAWVLNSACTLAKEWADEFQFMLSVNLSPSQFYDPEMFTAIKEMLEASEFPAANLKLEITEGVMLENSASNKDILNKLREIGISFAIDDFGTGNASLSYLKDFSIQQLKIDRSYINALHRPHHQLLIKSIIDLAHNMNMVVVAEGVETQEQENILKELQCDLAQGYKYGRPMASEQLKELLAAQRLT